MFERCLYFNSNALARTVSRVWGEEYARYGLSPPHAFLLRLVLARPGLLQRELAEELGLAKSTITRFVDSLAERGYVERRGSQEDGREQAIHPTDQAHGIHEALEQSALRLSERVRRILGAGLIDGSVRDMRHIRRVLDQE